LSDAIPICLVGTNNFAASHLRSIRQMEQEGLAIQTCAVIRRPEVYAEAVADYQSRGVIVYHSYEEMLAAEKGRTQLIALPVAIPEHAEMTIAALQQGYHVLLEKPPAPVIQQLDAMLQAEQQSGKICCVGFQNQSKCTVRAIKKLFCEGKLGRVQRIHVMAEWLRDDAYYARNAWAGKIMHQGKYCLDGSVCNALAHYLFNALYWSSDQWGQAAQPLSVRGELYHAHPIPSEDTAAVCVQTDTNVEIVYLVTLAGWKSRGPWSRIFTEKATIDWAISGNATITWADGTQEIIPDDGQREHDEVFRNCLRYLQGLEKELNCPLAMTRPYVLALNGVWESAQQPSDLSPEFVTRKAQGNSIFTGLNGISDLLDQGYAQGKTYSDLGAPWAVKTEWISLAGYNTFAREYPEEERKIEN